MTNRRQRRRERAQRRQPQPARRSTRLPYLLIGGGVLVVAAVAVIVFAALSRDSGADPAVPVAVQDEPTPVAAQDAASAASDPSPAPTQAEAPAVPLVTLEEFGDFQCSHCAQFALGMGRQLKKDFVDKGRLNFVFRHFPFIGEESFRAAEATECARDQDKFWEYHDIVFENWNGVNKGAYSDDNLKEFANGLQLDRGAFDSCLDGGKYRGKVQEDLRAGERMGVNSTPSLFLQGRRIQVADYSELAGLIESAIAAAQ